MRISVSSLALLIAGASAAAAASASNADNSNLAITHVRSLGMRALHQAHSKARVVGRRMQDSNGGDVDIDGLFGDGGDLDIDSMLGGGGDEDEDDYLDFLLGGGIMDMINPDLICGFLPLITSDPTFADALDAFGMSCSKFGCDEDNSHLVMNCAIAGELCSSDDPYAGTQRRRLGEPEEDDEFCVQDSSVEMSMELDFQDSIEIVTKQCCTYTKPDYMADLGPGCLSMTTEVDFEGLMGEVMDMMGDMMETGTFPEEAELTPEEAAAEAQELLQYYSIKECHGEFDGGSVTCECVFCDDGMGVSLSMMVLPYHFSLLAFSAFYLSLLMSSSFLNIVPLFFSSSSIAATVSLQSSAITLTPAPTPTWSANSPVSRSLEPPRTRAICLFPSSALPRLPSIKTCLPSLLSQGLSFLAVSSLHREIIKI